MHCGVLVTRWVIGGSGTVRLCHDSNLPTTHVRVNELPTSERMLSGSREYGAVPCMIIDVLVYLSAKWGVTLCYALIITAELGTAQTKWRGKNNSQSGTVACRRRLQASLFTTVLTTVLYGAIQGSIGQQRKRQLSECKTLWSRSELCKVSYREYHFMVWK